MVAICPNTNELWIYGNCLAQDVSSWEKLYTLTEHDLLISSIDWSPVTNKIVTCSHDRNAFVWTFSQEEGTWKPSLVVLRIDRAALDVKWSPDGKKFAVASGSKSVPVCHYQALEDWWVSSMIKKHKSTVQAISWHKNSQLLATASTDFKCRIISAFNSAVDQTQDIGPFDTPLPFGEVYCEFNCNGWVNNVSWSPSGDWLSFVGHDSSIHFVYFNGSTPIVQTLRYPDLPFNTLNFLSDKGVVACGHDYNPFLFYFNGDAWVFLKKLDEQSTKVTTTTTSSESGAAAARALFQNKVSIKQDTKEAETLWTKHESAITCCQSLGRVGEDISRGFSTCAMDGRLVKWAVNENQMF